MGDSMGKIISGFSNIGKSSLKKYKDISVIDFDTGYFRKDDGWVDMYIECLLALQEKYDYVLITTYMEVLEELNRRNIEYYLIYPERELKEEYRTRAIFRGSDDEFVSGFFSRWDRHISDCERIKAPHKFQLKSNEYLSDIIDKL